MRKNLFAPFYTTKGEGGTGLGLWVTRGIIEKHEGTIHFISSVRPGRSGTAFSVFLPFEQLLGKLDLPKSPPLCLAQKSIATKSRAPGPANCRNANLHYWMSKFS